MKKRILLITSIAISVTALIFAALKFNIFSPAEKTSSENTFQTSDKAVHGSAEIDKPDEEASEEEEKKETNDINKTTLLIYMIGSDLESRSGAGTEDLEELENSGINLKNVNVVVYAGGAPRWHNDLVSNKDNNVLELTDKGFRKVTSMDSSSMGTSKSLTEFLNYGYKNYPADSFALILWDHGNGPVIGYGKDMLFDNDSLTLSEMRAALFASPFSSSNKLAWIGFDACLMSSAELACTLDDFAYYLVASQEIEPSFGWNYDLFKFYGKNFNTPAFLSLLVEGYMKACQDYYDSRGFENRDTTLACIDLTKAGELEKAVNTLFERLNADMPSQYNTLVQKRVSTRALGRASTGSEYDLIDLNDMALQLETFYPEETAALKSVINSMVIKNGNNTEGCCGMSLYYPFYNKYYYENSWQKIYAGLGTFENYGNYLNKYQEIWLKDDVLDQYEKSPVPEKVNDNINRSSAIEGTYKLILSPSQIKYYADAKFYVMEKDVGEIYHPIITSENVKFEDGILYADFSGKAIFAKNRFGIRKAPVSIEHDTVGAISRYTLQAITNLYSNWKRLDFHMTLNNSTHEITTSSIVAHTSADDEIALSGGKPEEYALEDWDGYGFYCNEHKYLSRYPNGLIKPFAQWHDRGTLSYYPFPLRDGLEFVYEPLDKNNYYVMFEITDTRGSKYCSELLLVEGADIQKETVEMPEITIDWNNGDKAELASHENVTVYFKKMSEDGKAPYYTLEVKNDNDFNVIVQFSDIRCNGENTHLGSLYANIPAKASGYADSFPAKDDVGLGAVTDISSIKGILKIEEGGQYSTLFDETKVNINISGEASLGDLSEHYPKAEIIDCYLNATAEEQILLDTDDVSITLLGFGKNNIYGNPGFICCENKSEKPLKIDLDAYCINGITLTTYNEIQLDPGTKIYSFIGSPSDLAVNKITEIETLSFHISLFDYSSTHLYDKAYFSQWVPIKLSKHGKATVYEAGENVIYNNNSVSIILNEYKKEGEYPTWYATVINDSDTDLSFLNAGTKNVSISEKVGAHQRTNLEICYLGAYDNEPLIDDRLELNIQFMDFYGSEILFETEEPIILTAKEVEKEISSVSWSDGKPIVLLSTDGVTLSLKKETKGDSIIYSYDENHMDFENFTYTAYVLEAENTNDCNVSVTWDKMLINDNLHIYGNGYLNLKPGETKSKDMLDISDIVSLGVIDHIDSIETSISVANKDVYNLYFIQDEKHTINLSEESLIDISEMCPMDKPLEVEPYKDATAKEQVLWENDKFCITLIFFGESNLYNDFYMRFDNKSDEILSFDADAIAFNKISDSLYCNFTVNPGCTAYKGSSFYENGLISSLESLDIHLTVREGSGTDKVTDSGWVSVALNKHGKADPFIPGNNIVYDKNNIKIILNDVVFEDNLPSWNVTIINDNDFSVTLSSIYDFGGATLYSKKIGPGQHSFETVRLKDDIPVEYVEMKIKIKDLYGEEIFFGDDEIITFFAK